MEGDDEGERLGSRRWAWIEAPLAFCIYALDRKIKSFISILHFLLDLHFQFACLQYHIYIYIRLLYSIAESKLPRACSTWLRFRTWYSLGLIVDLLACMKVLLTIN